jgi:hypothetical protein
MPMVTIQMVRERFFCIGCSIVQAIRHDYTDPLDPKC